MRPAALLWCACLLLVPAPASAADQAKPSPAEVNRLLDELRTDLYDRFKPEKGHWEVYVYGGRHVWKGSSGTGYAAHVVLELEYTRDHAHGATRRRLKRIGVDFVPTAAKDGTTTWSLEGVPYDEVGELRTALLAEVKDADSWGLKKVGAGALVFLAALILFFAVRSARSKQQTA